MFLLNYKGEALHNDDPRDPVTWGTVVGARNFATLEDARQEASRLGVGWAGVVRGAAVLIYGKTGAEPFVAIDFGDGVTVRYSGPVVVDSAAEMARLFEMVEHVAAFLR